MKGKSKGLTPSRAVKGAAVLSLLITGATLVGVARAKRKVKGEVNRALEQEAAPVYARAWSEELARGGA